MKKSILTAAVAALAFSAPSTAVAQEKFTPEPEAIEAAVRYALPLALTGVQMRCTPHLSQTGYFATQGQELIARYTAGSDAYWPEAKALLLEMAAENADGDGAFLTQMPDEALKPMAAAMIPAAIAGEIKPDDCIRVEQITELLAPLPAENMGKLAAVFAEMMIADDAKKAAAAEAATGE